MGEPVHGEPPAIRIKLMGNIARELSVPLCYIHPVHPSGEKDEVIMIAGDSDNVGLEGVVVEARGRFLSWCVQLSGDSGAEAADQTQIMVL